MGKGLITEVCIKSWAVSELVCIQSDRRKNRAVFKYFWTKHLITCGQKLIMSKIRTAKKETWWCAHVLIIFLTHRKFTSQGCLFVECICSVIHMYFHRFSFLHKQILKDWSDENVYTIKYLLVRHHVVIQEVHVTFRRTLPRWNKTLCFLAGHRQVVVSPPCSLSTVGQCRSLNTEASMWNFQNSPKWLGPFFQNDTDANTSPEANRTSDSMSSNHFTFCKNWTFKNLLIFKSFEDLKTLEFIMLPNKLPLSTENIRASLIFWNFAGHGSHVTAPLP